MFRPAVILTTALLVIAFLAFLFWPFREHEELGDDPVLEGDYDESIDWETYEGDPRVGQGMAEELCSRCHAVGPSGESPVGDAPPFRTFASQWPLEYLDEALAEGIMVGHPQYQMPVFQFSEREIADLIAYMQELADEQ